MAPNSAASSFSESSRRGCPPSAAIACSAPPESTKMVVPSVLTMSGSSTPASCTLVSDVSPASSEAPDSGALGTPLRSGGRATGRGAWRLA